MTRRLRTILITLAAILVVALVGAIVFIIPNMRNNDTTADTAAPSPSTASPAPGASDSEPNTGEQGFGIPDSDLSGRTVMIPNNPAGQPLPQRDPSGPRTECTKDGKPVTSPESMMIQRNFGRSTLYSETDGPSRFDGLVLAGYTPTPQGAALAAANFIARMTAGGPVAAEVISKLTTLGDAVPEDLRAGVADEPVKTDTDPLRASIAFKILSCTDSFAVVELAMIRDVDDHGNLLQSPTYTGFRYNMVWGEGTWKVRGNTSRAAFGPYSSLDGFTRWTL